MARQFTATAGDDYIENTSVAATDTGDWTYGCWFFLSSVTNGGRLLDVCPSASTSSVQSVIVLTGPNRFVASQFFGTTSASSATNEAPVTGSWQCVFSTFRVSDAKCRVFVGTISVAVAELTYSSQAAGVGTRNTGGVRHRIGDSYGLNRPFDGAVARPFFWARELNTTEMNTYRTGTYPAQDGSLRYFWPLLGADLTDLSGNGKHPTATGTTPVGDPPLPTPGVSFPRSFTSQ